MTLANIAGCFIGAGVMLNYLNYHNHVTLESFLGLLVSVLCLLNVLLIWSPIRFNGIRTGKLHWNLHLCNGEAIFLGGAGDPLDPALKFGQHADMLV